MAGEDVEPKRAPSEPLPAIALDHRIIDAMPGGLVQVSPTGKILAANREARRILGLRYDELSALYTQDFETETINEDGSPCPLEDYPVSLALSTREPQGPVTIGVRRPDRSVSWAVFTAVPVLDSTTREMTGVVVTFLDVTRNLRTERSLRHSEARLRSILTSAPTVVLHADLEGTILYVNRVTPPLTVEEVVGTNLLDYPRPSERAMVARHLRYVLEHGEVVSYEAGSEIDGNWYDVRIAPVLYDDETVGVTMTVLDVTDRRYLQAQLMQADRMVSVGTLAAGVAHEINNPLTYVLASLRRAELTMEEEPSRNGVVEELIGTAAEGAARIAEIVRDLTGFLQPSPTEHRPLSLESVIETAAKMTAHQTKHHAQVNVTVETEARVAGNPTRLGQVFVNLLVNAAHAIPPGHADGNAINVRILQKNDETIEVIVEDTGSGIPEDALPRIFDPFFTTKGPSEGTGLGLYVCRGIVTAHSGQLIAENRPSGGARFRVHLPVWTTDDEDFNFDDNVIRPRKGRRLKVLVVDEEPGVLAAFGHALTDHTLRLVPEGTGAIAAILDEEYDAIFCALNLSDTDGLGVFEATRGIVPANAFIFMSEGPIAPTAKLFLRREGVVCIAKPLSADVISRTLHALIHAPN